MDKKKEKATLKSDFIWKVFPLRATFKMRCKFGIMLTSYKTVKYKNKFLKVIPNEKNDKLLKLLIILEMVNIRFQEISIFKLPFTF